MAAGAEQWGLLGRAIETTHDLREYARDVLIDVWLTHAEEQRVRRLIKALSTPEQREQLERRCLTSIINNLYQGRHGKLPDLDATIAKFRQRKAIAEHGTATGRQQGDKTRADIIHRWRVMTIDPRARAKIIADRLKVTDNYVRRVIKAAGLK